jgi:hypothetical protein
MGKAIVVAGVLLEIPKEKSGNGITPKSDTFPLPFLLQRQFQANFFACHVLFLIISVLLLSGSGSDFKKRC